MTQKASTDIVRISVEVPESFRRKLKTAVTDQGKDMTEWLKEKGEQEIAAYEGKK